MGYTSFDEWVKGNNLVPTSCTGALVELGLGTTHPMPLVISVNRDSIVSAD